MQDAPKAVRSIPIRFCGIFSKFKTEFYCISLSESVLTFSWVYSNSCCSCWFEPEIIEIEQSSYKMNSNKILNFQEYTTILNACTKKSRNLLNASGIFLHHRGIEYSNEAINGCHSRKAKLFE